MTNAEATAATVATLLTAGRLDAAEHAASIQAARSLAEAVDVDPGNAALWRQYQAATETLMSAGADDGSAGDEVEAIIAALRGAAAVVDATNAKPSDARRRGGGPSGTTRKASPSLAASRR